MPARVSATGITPHKHGTEPSTDTSANREAVALKGDTGEGVKVPAPNYSRPSQPGSKVSGATRTKGGAI